MVQATPTVPAAPLPTPMPAATVTPDLPTAEIPAPSPAVAVQRPPAPVRGVVVSWSAVDHPSGIYHAKDDARLSVVIDNLTEESFGISGEILFGPRPAANEAFKPLAVIPIASTKLSPGERAQIPLQVSFGAAGPYELRLRQGNQEKPIEAPSSSGLSLECIFAPRMAATREDSPWITPLPRAALSVPGYLADTITQTSVHRFLIDERFAFDSRANIGLGFGASWATSAGREATTRELDALLADLSRARATLVLRVAAPTVAPDARTLSAFRAYIVDAIRRSHGALRGIVIAPDTFDSLTLPQRAAFRSYYLAGYEAAKRQDRNILLLGAGTAQATLQALPDLSAYVDAYAVTDAAGQPGLVSTLNGESRRKPLWILPPQISDPWPLVPPPATLAQGAAIVPLPPPQVDRGVSAHLLGGAVLYQRVHLAVANADPANPPPASELPYIVVFQGDRYALGAIAGLSANTPIDALFPGLAHTRTAVEPQRPDGKPPYPSLEVSDDTHSMRVVDGQGNPVDCRIGGGGDSIFVPAGDQFVYVLQAGSAEELAGSLRPSTPHRLPVAEISAVRPVDPGQPDLVLKLRNITASNLTGTVRLIVPSEQAGGQPAVLAQMELQPLPPGNSMELPVNLATPSALPPSLLVELTANKSVVQRTALLLGKGR